MRNRLVYELGVLCVCLAALGGAVYWKAQARASAAALKRTGAGAPSGAGVRGGRTLAAAPRLRYAPAGRAQSGAVATFTRNSSDLGASPAQAQAASGGLTSQEQFSRVFNSSRVQVPVFVPSLVSPNQLGTNVQTWTRSR
jgi:hypothetical protein